MNSTHYKQSCVISEAREKINPLFIFCINFLLVYLV